jgi:hypothetical protein
MPQGKFRLLAQKGGRGAFASVTLEIEVSESPTRVTVAETESVPRYYVSAAETGIRFALEQLMFEGHKPPSVNVVITEIVESTVDTTEMMVVYAAANALCDGLGLSLLRPIEFDGTNHRMIFPLGR